MGSVATHLGGLFSRSRETPASPRRYLLYGSCVSRDTYQYVAEPKRLVRYIARQSMISAGTDSRELGFQLPALASAFQERTSREDMAGTAGRLIRRLAAETDLLVIDLLDERGGVYRSDDGAFLTRTPERVGVNADDVVGRERIVAFGTDEHYQLWRAGWGRLLDLIQGVGLASRTVALGIPWATKTTAGTAPPPSFGMTPEAANQLFQRYLDAVAVAGIPVLRPRWWRGPALAEPGHQWGLAPFHYAAPVYHDLAHQLETHAARAARSLHRRSPAISR